MTHWLTISLVIILISGALGFTNILGASALWVFRIIFSVFLVVFLVNLVMRFL